MVVNDLRQVFSEFIPRNVAARVASTSRYLANRSEALSARVPNEIKNIASNSSRFIRSIENTLTFCPSPVGLWGASFTL